MVSRGDSSRQELASFLLIVRIFQMFKPPLSDLALWLCIRIIRAMLKSSL